MYLLTGFYIFLRVNYAIKLTFFILYHTTICVKSDMSLPFACGVATGTASKISHYEPKDIDLFILSNSVCSSNRLVLYSWIPMGTGEVNLLKMLKIKSLTSGLNLYHEDIWS